MRANLISILLITLLAWSSCNEESVFNIEGLDSADSCNDRILKHILPLFNNAVDDVGRSNFENMIRQKQWDDMRSNGEGFIKECRKYLIDSSCFESIAKGIRYSNNPDIDYFYNNIYPVNINCTGNYHR